MSKVKRYPAAVLFLSTVVLIVSACKKPDEDLGLDLLPGDPLGITIDTSLLRVYTVEDTAVRTNGLSVQLLGSYLDPQFGSVKAGLITQLRLSANNIGDNVDPAGLVADSLVLGLAFNGANYAYGNLDPQVFQVFELSESLSLDSSYTTYRTPQVQGGDLVADRGGRITPQPLSEPNIGGVELPPQLRIRLSQELAERFLDAFGSSNLANNDTFLSYFKGLYVAVDNGGQNPYEGGILYFNLTSSASKATLYYRDLNDQPDLQRSLDFLINSNCVRYTVVEHDHAAAVDGALPTALADTITEASTAYVQSMGGTRTVVRMPGLMEHAGADRVLAKAELIVPVNGSFYPYYLPPAQLFLFREDTSGQDVFLPDQLAGIGAIDGAYRIQERAYRFNITRYVQRVLNGTYPNRGVEIVPGSGGVSANRVILNTPGVADDPMRLRLTFTTY